MLVTFLLSTPTSIASLSHVRYYITLALVWYEGWEERLKPVDCRIRARLDIE